MSTFCAGGLFSCLKATRVSYCGAANFLTKPRRVTAQLAGGDGNTAHLVNNAGITGNTACAGRDRGESDAMLELDSLKCNWYGYGYDREQSYGECRPHHEFRRLRRRRGNDFGGNREKPPDQPGRGAEDPQAPRAGGTGRSLPRPSWRRRDPAAGLSHNARSDLQGGW